MSREPSPPPGCAFGAEKPLPSVAVLAAFEAEPHGPRRAAPPEFAAGDCSHMAGYHPNNGSTMFAAASSTSPAHELAQCQQQPWHAGVAGGVEQKVSALSRRTAGELRRAEKERGDLARRLEALEELCRERLGGVEATLGQATEAAALEAQRAAQWFRSQVDRDLKAMSEVLQQHKGELKASQQGLDELRSWREEVQHRLSSSAIEVDAGRSRERATDLASSRMEEQLDAALCRERKQAHERLRASCAELTSHLNELRQELVEQRRAAQQGAEKEEARRESLRADLETQIAELGRALASRLQGTLAATVKVLDERVDGVAAEVHRSLGAIEDRCGSLEGSSEWLGGQVQLWRRENAALHSGLSSVQELVHREAEQCVEQSRDEARTIHCEVMSIDTRVASIEAMLTAKKGAGRSHDADGLNGAFSAVAIK
mmetsp:Transcript_29315/g.63769  ORF Transcript_29315/g.63769 Transcript_29315/m.63769 type:complete len:430 (-) Transcript_29315:78-1367(-)